MTPRRQRIATAPVPSAQERRRQIESEPLPPNILALIESAATAGGDNLLWNFFESGETLTYAELRPRVFGLAAGLMSLGVRKGTHVAVMLPNKAAFPLTWLAIGAIGAVMIPVNNTYSEREIAFVLTDSEAEFLVVDEACLAAVERVAIAAFNAQLTPKPVAWITAAWSLLVRDTDPDEASRGDRACPSRGPDLRGHGRDARRWNRNRESRLAASSRDEVRCASSKGRRQFLTGSRQDRPPA